MTIAYRSSSASVQTTSGGAGAITLTAPSGYQAGDLLVLTVATGSSVSPAVPSGFTQSAASSVFNHVTHKQYQKIAGSESFPYTITSLGSDGCATLACYSSPDPTTPFDAYAWNTAGSTTSVVVPSLTTAHANEMLVHTAFAHTGAPATFTTPSGFTLRATSSYIDGSLLRYLYHCDALQSAAGATASVTDTWSATQTYLTGIVAAYNSVLSTPQFWTDFIKSQEVDS